eukprot:TRINITY_DN68953_c0_g1_i1.p1 TRINITY_DN68953_c0_g1~~TRINITY_DN68953_c0_g1_i1.p1  ORF type:complete len:372 (-),score=43.09 TRINITY_DN68953_c0_g1_i1:97-1161(-)
MTLVLEKPLFDDGPPIDAAPKRTKAVGYLCCAAVVASWVGQSEVSQAVQVEGYNKPMAITWVNHSAGILLLVMLVPLVGPRRIRCCWDTVSEGRSRWQLFGNVFFLSTVYLVADWVWYIGLPFISVAVGTIIFNTCPVWVYALSVATGREPRRWQRTVALLVSLLGVVVVACAPEQSQKGDANAARNDGDSISFWGVGLVLAAAIGYAIYEVLLDRSFGHVCRSDTFAASVLTSVFGLLTVFVLWPAVAFLGIPAAQEPFQRIGIWEEAELPSAAASCGLVMNALLATTFNFTLVLAVTMSSAFMASFSCILTIPVSLVADTILHGCRFGAWEIVGSAFVFGGFAILAFDDRKY